MAMSGLHFGWRVRIGIGLVAAALLAQPAAAQQYPTQQITLVVAFAAGGVADTVARVIGQKLSERLKQNVVVENRGGAGGSLGAKIVAAANADGHTLLVTTTALAINDTISKNKGYATDDLRPVAIAASTPESLSVNPSNPAKTLGEFVQNAKGKSISFGTAGIGTGSYIAAEYFFRAIAKIESVHVPFTGGPPVISAGVGNHIDMVAVSLPAAVAAINQNQLRGLGVASPQRAPSVPNVPTYAEAGFPDFYAASWVGFFAPTKTADTIVAKLNGEINEIIKDPDVVQRLSAVGFDAISKSQAETAAYFKSEVETWGKMARTVGVTTD